MSVLGHNAKDIDVGVAELCLILGYLSSPNRIGLIEAQIPEDKVFLFEREFPNAPYYPIKQGKTVNGNIMKQGCQLRIYFNNIFNCPQILMPFLGVGVGKYVKRINKGKFVERIVKKYGFAFGENQIATTIRNSVLTIHPANIIDFDRGYHL
jgi:hypothetical protein